MPLRPNVVLQQTGRLLMERAPRALLSIALQLNLGVSWRLIGGADPRTFEQLVNVHR
jgi:hypothetical protein